ncbi:UDP-N-acetylmuramate dehydrogenase [Persephonella sp.]
MKQVHYEELVDLSRLCTIKVGGKAKKVYFPENIEQVKQLITQSVEENKRFVPLGVGSNTVFADGVLDHIFVSTKKLKKLQIIKKDRYFFITAEAGVSFKTIVSVVKKYNLEGFEYLSGIPASIGGAVVMNAGAFGSQISDILEEVVWIDMEGNVHRLPASTIDFGYRTSPFQKGGFVYSAVLKLKQSERNISSVIKKHLEERNRKQPLDLPTSGSTFKNPPEKPAGYLLERAGMKGFRIGGMAFSEKHANFLVNLGGGRFKDLKELIETAERRVGELYQIKLEREIRIVE